MEEGSRLMRGTQRISELVQDRTGWTCYRQAGYVAMACATAIAACETISAAAGKLPFHAQTTAAIAVCSLASVGARRMRGSWAVALAMMAAAGMFLEVLCIAEWWFGVPFASSGDMPSDMAMALGLGEVGWGLVLLRTDREYVARCLRGDTGTASVGEDTTLAFDVAICIGFATAAVAHRDLPSTLGLVVAALFIGSALLALCRPRPPSTKRRRATAASGLLAASPA